MRIEVTRPFRGSLGELYYKEVCNQKGWAYCSLENIYNNKLFGTDRILVFKKGFSRINIRIPERFVAEVIDLARPTNLKDGKPSFVFDYLACKVGRGSYPTLIDASPPFHLCWAEIKTGGSDFTNNQVKALSRITMPLAVFYIEHVLAPPDEIEIEWEMKPGAEWLNEIEKDDQRDSDDDEDGIYYY